MSLHQSVYSLLLLLVVSSRRDRKEVGQMDMRGYETDQPAGVACTKSKI